MNKREEVEGGKAVGKMKKYDKETQRIWNQVKNQVENQVAAHNALVN